MTTKGPYRLLWYKFHWIDNCAQVHQVLMLAGTSNFFQYLRCCISFCTVQHDKRNDPIGFGFSFHARLKVLWRAHIEKNRSTNPSSNQFLFCCTLRCLRITWCFRFSSWCSLASLCGLLCWRTAGFSSGLYWCWACWKFWWCGTLWRAGWLRRF
jgi:hypothetical protein